MNRLEWQQIAEERLIAAQALIAANCWASAYYLTGYAVECGLKSCVLARLAVAPEIIFRGKEGKNFSSSCWTHDIESLVRLSDVRVARDADIVANPVLGGHWLIVKDWSEASRYQMKAQAEAEALYNAIADNANGVMQWIRARW